MDLVRELHSVVAALEKHGIRYAVCGGLAVTMHGAPRTTQDIDLVVAPDQIDDAKAAVRAMGYRFEATPMVFDRDTDTQRSIHRVTRIEGEHAYVLDLLSAEGYLDAVLGGRVSVDLPEGALWLVSRSGLAAMKRVSARPQDLRDIQLLGLDDA